jgi:hypothetical protein
MRGTYGSAEQAGGNRNTVILFMGILQSQQVMNIISSQQ